MNKFKFELEYKNMPHSNLIVSHLVKHKDYESFENIGSIRPKFDDKKNKSEPKWAINAIGNYIIQFEVPRYQFVFDTQEQAAEAILLIAESVNANPLPNNLKYYIADRAKTLNKERQECRDKLFNIQYEMRTLQQIAKSNNYNLEFNVSVKQEAQDVLDFMNEHNDDIYEKLGKDWARTLRALVRSLLETVDPDVSQDI